MIEVYWFAVVKMILTLGAVSAPFCIFIEILDRKIQPKTETKSKNKRKKK